MKKILEEEEVKSLLKCLNEKVGVIFNESNSLEFDSHVNYISTLGTKSIFERINLLFGWISNLRYLIGDSVETNTFGMLEIITLKEYNFSMINELGVLCSLMISIEMKKNYEIDTQEKFDLFREIMFNVDDVVRNNKIQDSKGSVILLEMLTKHLFKIESV